MRKLFFILIPLGLLTGCLSNPLYKPSARLKETVLVEYKIYVTNDKKLTDEQKNRRLKGVRNYERLLEDYREVEGD